MTRELRHGTRYHFRKGCHCTECAGADRAHNDEWAARRRKHDQPGRPPSRIDGPCRCACGHDCPNRTALGRHTWARHERPPTDAERALTVEVAA